jgi:4-diphosphocytidyl-2-C-methyl-D-erythritol kinase
MIKKSFAKVNITLKITGKRENYHTISSRFTKIYNLFDTIYFKKKDKIKREFELIGNFGCPTSQNSIYKAYIHLMKFLNDKKIERFFHEHYIEVDKKIPEFAGLGGGSSNAAAFLNLTNEVLNLGLKRDLLAKIGAKIGADVPFFIYEYSSANISGIGEIIERFEEEPMLIETITPPIECDTTKVYRKYRENHYNDDMDMRLINRLEEMKSADILKEFDDETLNDLLLPAIKLYPSLNDYRAKNRFFSGSGSSFFRIDNG